MFLTVKEEQETFFQTLRTAMTMFAHGMLLKVITNFLLRVTHEIQFSRRNTKGNIIEATYKLLLLN